MPGIYDLRLDETPVAIIDLETTGLSPRSGARIVEVSVVRVDPGEQPRLVLDTLVDPQGPVHGTRIHGIDDEDVVGAPMFSDVAGAVAHAIEGAVVGAFNATFDMTFLQAESVRSRKLAEWPRPPFICLMYLRPALEIGERTTLESALRIAGLPAVDHRAAHDALATAELWLRYRDYAIRSDRRRFRDLVGEKEYKFAQSWASRPYDLDAARRIGPERTSSAFMPRRDPVNYGRHTATVPHPHQIVDPVRVEKLRRSSNRSAYAHALIDVLADNKVDDSEVRLLLDLQSELELSRGEIRAIHASFYSEVLRAAIADEFVSHQEAANIRALGPVLSELGWSPGDPSEPQ